MIERIGKIIENEGVSTRAFEQKISASNGLIRKAIANNTDIQSKWVTMIVDKFPHYSTDWLLTGEGPMLKKDLPVAQSVGNETNEGIPLIPISAFAGIASGEVSVLEYECERYIIPIFKDAEFLISVKGSSMIPKYSSGDIVACKKLDLSDIFFQWNKVYVIDTDQGVLVKRIHKAKDPDHIKVVSENPRYEPFELHLSKIYAIAIVIGVVRLE